ncbi:MAG: hypothetical protein HY895_11735 [Deltaproteobacteria bacterium]|nr:hypothetical protein [Deltaproteobacteria bacterium]
MHGFYNVTLRVDVSQKAFEIERLSDSILKKTLGGKGLAIHLLLKFNPPGVGPLKAENHLIFATGPVSKTSLWGSCRHGVYTKSPLTGFYAESYSGGPVAEAMASTGFDAVMIHGAAEEPVWLEICEDTVYFHSAAGLRRLNSYQTEDRIKAWLKTNRPQARRTGVVCIGPTGEDQAAIAVIENDHGCRAGRTGVGAVMGSKKIKAVAFWGDRQKDLADAGLLGSFARDIAREAKVGPGVQAYNNLRTPMRVDIMNTAGGFPARYWKNGKAGVFAEGEDRLTIFDTLIICRCYRDLYQWDPLATIIKAATGMELGVRQMREIAGSVIDDTRRFNLREGLPAQDDRLALRLESDGSMKQ